MDLIVYLFTEKVYEGFFVNADFGNPELYQILLSKLLSYGILLGSLFYKLPQILAISRAGSAKGISLLSLGLELLSCTATVTYSMHMGFSFTTYGEAFFIIFMDLVIAWQVFTYDRKPMGAFMLTLLSYTAALGILLSPVFPDQFAPMCQMFITPLIIFSRVPQIYANFAAWSTGSLSLITWGLNLGGSSARIFTSMTEVGDNLVLLGFVIAAALNAVIFLQIFFIGSAEQKKPAALSKKKKTQ